MWENTLFVLSGVRTDNQHGHFLILKTFLDIDQQQFALLSFRCLWLSLTNGLMVYRTMAGRCTGGRSTLRRSRHTRTAARPPTTPTA